MAGLRAAREEFYSGDIARAMVACSDRVGGLLSMEDLASYSASFEEPLKTSYMGYEVYTQSTWTQGAVVLQTLNILEHFDLRGMGHNSTQYIHTVAEALKLAFADREAHYGDPDYVRVPIEGLLSKEYAAARAGLIQADRASPGLPPPGDPWRYCLGPSPARPAELAYPGAYTGGRRRRGRRGHHLPCNHGPGRERGVRHAQRRIFPQDGVHPRAGVCIQHTLRGILPGRGTPQRAAARQTAPHHTG